MYYTSNNIPVSVLITYLEMKSFYTEFPLKHYHHCGLAASSTDELWTVNKNILISHFKINSFSPESNAPKHFPQQTPNHFSLN